MSEPSALYSRQLVHTFRTNDVAAAIYNGTHTDQTRYVSKDACPALVPDGICQLTGLQLLCRSKKAWLTDGCSALHARSAAQHSTWRMSAYTSAGWRYFLPLQAALDGAQVHWAAHDAAVAGRVRV